VARTRRAELLGQIADEADGVGDDHLALLGEAQPAADRIERGEQLVLGDRVEPSVSALRSVDLPALV
jgi:hypothetical protein